MKLRNKVRIFILAAVALISTVAITTLAQNGGDPILRGFQNPPDSAKPRVWWHWMNGNISKEGIKLDLEWMKRVGIGGFQNFDGGGMGRGASASWIPKMNCITQRRKDAKAILAFSQERVIPLAALRCALLLSMANS